MRRVPTPPTASSDASARAEDPDAPLLAALRAGDEQAFATLVTRYHATLRRVARSYVSTDAVAEDVVQETWLAVIGGLDRFEQRATLKTWLFHILMNKAKTRGVRERVSACAWRSRRFRRPSRPCSRCATWRGSRPTTVAADPHSPRA